MKNEIAAGDQENKMVSVCRRLLDILEREQSDIVGCNLDGIEHYLLIKDNMIKEMQDPANAASWNSEAHIPELRSLMKRIVERTALNEKALLETRAQVAAKLDTLGNTQIAVKSYKANQ